MPPRKSRFNPVAVTITSASSSSPDSISIPPSVKVAMRVGGDRDAALGDRPEEVAVGGRAGTLLPRVVAGREVLVDVVAGRERALCGSADDSFCDLGATAAELEDKGGERHVFPADEGVGEPIGQDTEQRAGDPVLVRQREDVGGRALQHRHVFGALVAIAGTSVTAVAPLPITTTRLPV